MRHDDVDDSLPKSPEAAEELDHGGPVVGCPRHRNPAPSRKNCQSTADLIFFSNCMSFFLTKT